MTLFNKASRIVNAIARHNDIAMVALLVIVITLMIMPLPTALVDTFIGANLTISFLMLMMSMYVKSPLQFSVFPTMLLFTTLFRVGLNITTTRLILLQADAGEIIYTFGEFATGSNFVVGAVVFLILTVVQFLVIAKGAERVAEVGARFTLDAMPGKQMSIDADLRAGVIDMDEAQRRRNNVQMESKMYGAMDGAMKFVKGDSIAGMVVTVINIIGGTIIGVTQNGMAAGDALQLYGVLTIGDGLVSQIPSLLVSISAGILITRSGDTAEDVGAQVGRQFFDQPRAMQMAGGLIFLLALIPGFPKPQLFTMAFAVYGFGMVLAKIKNAPAEPDKEGELKKTLAPVGSQQRKKAVSGGDEFSPTVPIILDISPDISESMDYDTLNAELVELRHALYFDLGVPFPGINIRPNPNLASYSYSLNLNEIPIAHGQLVKGYVIVRESKANLNLLGIKFILRPVMTTKESMAAVSPRKRFVQSMLSGTVIGFICGFIGAGGGMMMLLLLTSVLGYELKTAVGTSVFIMTFTALTGAVSHFAIGGLPDPAALVFCVLSTLLWARIAARFANKAPAKTLNRATGGVLTVLGAAILLVQ